MSMSTTIDPNEGSSTKPLLRAHQFGGVNYKYMECLKNHAAGIGGSATDGCREFMAGGEPGSLEALKCCACNCHRNFHRKIIIHDQVQELVASSSSSGRRRKRFRSKFSDRES